MTQKPNSLIIEKTDLHPRNRHRNAYDFVQLIENCKELGEFVAVNKYGNESIDFSNPLAVKTLNMALLKAFYKISYWDVPEGYLCPPVPGRADYLHYMADLLALTNGGVIPTGNLINVLDIGVGANCIYPIIGINEYGWKFTGSDIDEEAITNAKKIADNNPHLSNQLDFRLQKTSSDIFRGVVYVDEKFDLTVCNPPFHTSQEEAEAGTQRKWRNLAKGNLQKTGRNFGGKNVELWCKGGEVEFIKNTIRQSIAISKNCLWFSSLVAKESNLRSLYGALKKANVETIKTIDIAQGQKIGRILAWTFLNGKQQAEWKQTRWKK